MTPINGTQMLFLTYREWSPYHWLGKCFQEREVDKNHVSISRHYTILCSFVRIHGVKLRLKRFPSSVSHFVIENYVFTAKGQQVREIWLVCTYKIVFSVFCLVWVNYFVIYYICKTGKIEDKMQYYMDEKGFPKIRNWTRWSRNLNYHLLKETVTCR